MKKPRGFKQKHRQAAQLTAASPPLAVARVQQFHYHYEKLGHGPLHHWLWQSAPLPRPLRQLGAAWLLQTFFQWQESAIQLAEPVYLAIWLSNVDFASQSQVVAAIQGRIGWYENIFGEPAPTGPPLPPEFQSLPGAEQLTWTTHRRHEWLDAEDFPNGWPARLLRREHTLHTLEDGRAFLEVPRGWVWVGQQAVTDAPGANPRLLEQ
ncbi:hypothetical protein [Hymenobacter aerophilus]|uniref:hypothetical protein n=1 Tax=Hymenobacter aerophilus TaxID=119644 RepID=UPI00037F0468|nr:hypothetical protein [Hymenobacter aerophilus]